jgi:serine/threonine protein kinase/WD40 repeat protein
VTEREIFVAALGLDDPAARAAHLDQACGADAALRRRVEALLHAHAEAGGFLERPAAAAGPITDPPAAGRWVAPDAPGEGPGSRVGPYKLLQQLGEGGMGVVFMAEQEEPVRRRVAVKVIKPGMDSAQVVARFEQERQALALMDHPNIARVLDAGATESGRPYFVMELVKGIPITRYCDQERLAPRERLELFLPVCQAVQHAHQKGVIHRDLKPSNVLIALYDGKPVPKVIDFGVAKATGQKLTERTMFTAVGSIVGTLEYMAPEQAELNNLDVDTRADIYSLGALLYELLTGSPPFSAKQLRGAAFDEMMRIIREVEPPRPSTKLSHSDELSSIAAKRKLDPKRLTRLVHGDLDWVVMKCLEKERGRRYETAAGLAQDLRRYLADEPVQAGPPSAAYRLRKFASRHRTALAAAAAFVGVLIVSAVVCACLAVLATWAEQGALNAEKAVTKERDDARQARDDLKVERDNVQHAKDDLQRAQDETLVSLYDARAYQIQDAGNADRLDALLGLQVPEPGQHDLRGFEWYYWQRRRHAEVRTVKLPERHVRMSVLSPDGRRVAEFAVKDGEWLVTVVDAAGGKELCRCPVDLSDGPYDEATAGGIDDSSDKIANTANTRGFGFSADGARLFLLGRRTGGGLRIPGKNEIGCSVWIWDAATGERVAALRGLPHNLLSVSVSPNGRQVAAFVPTGNLQSQQDAALKVWDAADGKELSALEGFTLPAVAWNRAPAFSGDGKRVAAVVLAGDGGHLREATIKVWALPFRGPAAGAERLSIKRGGNEHMTTGLAFSPDGRRIAAAWYGYQPASSYGLWDADTGQELVRLEAPNAPGPCPVFSPDGALLAVGVGGALRILDADHGRVRLALPVRWQDITAGELAFSPDGKQLSAMGGDRTIRTWDATATDLPMALTGLTSHAQVVAISPDGMRVAAAGRGEGGQADELRVWDLAGKPLLSTVLPSPAGDARLDHHSFSRLCFSGDGKRLALKTDFQFWSSGQNRPAPEALFSVWEVADGKEIFRVREAGLFQDMALSPDGRRVAASERAGPVKMWDVASGREVGGIDPGPALTAHGLAFSSDGGRLAGDATNFMAAKSTSLRVWNVADRAELLRMNHTFTTQTTAFSPDGKLIALAMVVGWIGPHDVKVFDAASGDLLLTLRGHNALVRSVAFSADGRRIVSTDDGAVKVWDAATGAELLTLARHAGNFVNAALTPDGRRLAAVAVTDSGGCAVQVWDGAPSPNDGKADAPAGR